MPTRLKTNPQDRIRQQEIITLVGDTAMHILHNSYLYGSDLWPVNGFKTGSYHGANTEDMIYYCVNPYGWELSPIKGRLAFDIFNTPEKREALQVEHLRRIFDWSILNNILFEDEFKNTSPIDRIWFTFTINPNTL